MNKVLHLVLKRKYFERIYNKTKKGRYKADDKSTKDINEAGVGGKAPKKKRKK